MINASRVMYSLDVAADLKKVVTESCPASVAVIADSTVARIVLPQLSLPHEWTVITFPAGEDHKNISTCISLWSKLTSCPLTRRSLIINIGGGVTTDMGGFVASTFKRGIPFINVPTTLLCAVDAAVGGKTGIDFDNLKNQIGTFSAAGTVIIDSSLFSTLPREHLLSGYGEMIKHALLDSTALLSETLAVDLETVSPESLNRLLRRNIGIKTAIVESDPYEAGPRKALNLGHTFGHALESLTLERYLPIPHGVAVAHGLLVTLVLSKLILKFDSEIIRQLATTVRNVFPPIPAISCQDYNKLLQLMADDKKNTRPGQILFTLLSSPGNPVTDMEADSGTITTALDIYRDLIGQ